MTYRMQTAVAPMTVKDRITKHWDSFGSHCMSEVVSFGGKWAGCLAVLLRVAVDTLMRPETISSLVCLSLLVWMWLFLRLLILWITS